MILRHKVRGVNEKLSGQCSRPKIRFCEGGNSLLEPGLPSPMRCLSGNNLCFTSRLKTHRKVSADHRVRVIFSYITSQAPRFLHWFKFFNEMPKKKAVFPLLYSGHVWESVLLRFDGWMVGLKNFLSFFVRIKHLLVFQTTCFLMISLGKGDSLP